MATLVLSAAGAALGGSFGGSVMGLTTMAVGKAIGGTLGNIIDQSVLGQGAAAVETGRVENFRIMGAHEGTWIPRAYGRTRLAGQLIWSSRFLERVHKENVGGKGGGQTVKEFSYSINLGLALCEGEVLRIGRIWADGIVLDQSNLTIRLHHGTQDQLPDPLISAIEGAENTPTYRGTAYVVIEGLQLAPFGNRIPQFNFEVFRRPDGGDKGHHSPMLDVQGVALVPGTGEYALATQPLFFRRGKGAAVSINVHNDRSIPDLKASLDQMQVELPEAEAVSLVVSWFGDDLRCDRCRLQPKVEQGLEDAHGMAWRVSGVARANAEVVGQIEGRPAFGGTPTDQSVVQAIAHMRGRGKRVMFYPFILMDILAGNGLEDPWTGAANQPVVPWRGRITLSHSPGQAGSPDKSAAAADEVAAFFGKAKASDFHIQGTNVSYTGAPDWGYRRFILHYAYLCAAAGGVAAFCIGSELRGLTQIRDGVASYPFVAAMCRLVEDVRAILGPHVKIGYAADWSEYFGHQPADGSGDVVFHLDPLWSHDDVDFVGIDNYMPLSDWRDGDDHADAQAASIYELDYLKSNVAGGEGFDWYYTNQAARDAQIRTDIVDGAHGEDWIFRYKDLVNWWSQPHVNRIGGVRETEPTDWVPHSKPIWFTELGCPAVDKGTNQPNVFHDPKSSESEFPYYSTGAQDDFIQYQYLRAMFAHWSEAANNPVSPVYGGPMVDMSNAYVWAWDARPWPDFPNRLDQWVDGTNYDHGHWLNGRAAQVALAAIVGEICARSGVQEIDVSDLHGLVTGYTIAGVEDGRKSLQPLMLTHSFDSYAREGGLCFASRTGHVTGRFTSDDYVKSGSDPVVTQTRAPVAEAAGRVTLGFVRGDRDYTTGAAEAVLPQEAEASTSQTSLPIVMSQGLAQSVAERWLSESHVARDSLSLSLPPSSLAHGPGDVIAFEAGGMSSLYRVDRVDEAGSRRVTATRIEPALYEAPVYSVDRSGVPRVEVPVPVHAAFLDLPLLTGEEVPHAPHVAVVQRPWSGKVAVYSAPGDYGYALNTELSRPATMGVTLDPLPHAACGLWSEQSFRVQLSGGALQSRSAKDVLNGANVAALRHGSGDWEILQFRDAVLSGPGVYTLKGLLRGQAGTDGVVPPVWAAGADFVLLDGAPRQIDLPVSARGLERHFRVGPAAKPLTAPSYLYTTETFSAVGLRPYRPAHLKSRRLADGNVAISWIRRTRVDGDSWQGSDVPLGEEREAYHVRILAQGDVVREVDVTRPEFVYSLVDQVEDGMNAPIVIEVAQVSDRFGAGPYERTIFDG